jgi:hypothetical protein
MEWVGEGDVTPLIIQYAAARPRPRPYRGDIYEIAWLISLEPAGSCRRVFLVTDAILTFIPTD